MKAIALYSALLFVTGIANAAVDPPSPDIFQVTVEAKLPADSPGTTAVIATIPAGKRLVVQSITWLRINALQGSIAHANLAFQINGMVSYCALNVTADDAFQPGTTVAATFYANAGTQIVATYSRDGDDSYEEDEYFTVVGYYVSP